MKIAFILLAHESPDSLQPLIESILNTGSDIYIHYDKSSNISKIENEVSRWKIEKYKGKIYFAKPIRVEWGEWSIVQATLNCLYLAENEDKKYDYYTLISGSCMPIKPIALLEKYLSGNNKDYIEAVDAAKQKWVISGLQVERWEYFHFFNWRKTPQIFDRAIRLQKKYNIRRKVPNNLIPCIGSQWWCLRSSTISIILSYIKKNPNILGFYRKTWIPDESFFQTLVYNLVDKDDLSSTLILKHKFTTAGVPRVYHEDSLDELMSEDKFFARKIFHHAKELKRILAEIAIMSPEKYMSHILNKPHNQVP